MLGPSWSCTSTSTPPPAARCAPAPSTRCARRCAAAGSRRARRLPATRALAVAARGLARRGRRRLRPARRRGLPADPPRRRDDGRRRAGRRAAGRGAPVAPAPSPAALVPRYDLRPSLPAVDGFPRAVWLAALTRVLRSVPDARLGYGATEGEPELRTALAGALARTRGVRALPEQVVVTTGTRHGTLPLLWRLLRRARCAPRRHRAPRLAAPAPDPGDDGHRGGAACRSTTTASTPPALRNLRLDAVVVTPAHQFPTGAVLSAERRAALVEWARERRDAPGRGRLRRRVPLRPPADRLAAGPGPRAGGLLRLGVQDACARAGHRLGRASVHPGRDVAGATAG